MRKTSNRQIQYNVENFDKIHASAFANLGGVSRRNAQYEFPL